MIHKGTINKVNLHCTNITHNKIIQIYAIKCINVYCLKVYSKTMNNEQQHTQKVMVKISWLSQAEKKNIFQRLSQYNLTTFA